MKTWTCTCGATLHFRNLACLACGRAVGHDPRTDRMLSVEAPAGDLPDTGQGASIAWPEGLSACSHRHAAIACHWLVAPGDRAGDEAGRCLSCRLTEVAPDMSVPGDDERRATNQAPASRPGRRYADHQ